MLGIQSDCLFQNSGQDPLERLLAGSTYTNGGPARYINTLKLAIKAFIDREHPDVGEKGLKVVLSLPTGQEGITWEELSLHCVKERLGGVISGKLSSKDTTQMTKCPADDPALHTQSLHAMDPSKRKALEELKKKYRGEEGERSAILPLIEWFTDSAANNRDATMILGQKSSLELIEQSMYNDLSRDVFQDLIDRKIATVEKVAEAVGLKLDIPAIEAESETIMMDFFGHLGSQPVADMKWKIQNKADTAKSKWKNTKKMLLEILNKTNSLHLDLFKDIKHQLMKKRLNEIKKEHDIVFFKPHQKTVGQIEVKAMQNLQTHEVTKSLEQLEGGRKEVARAHGHVLDRDWSYLGVVALPNLPADLKQQLCQNLKICGHCAQFILVGDMHSAIKVLMDTSFPAGSECPDELTWRAQYKELSCRVLAMEHLAPPIAPLRRITGTDEGVVAAFTKGFLHDW